jgi:hypothetical protein
MTTKGEILKAIRSNCLECCCGSSKEVELCPVECSLKSYRFGKDPNPSRMSNFPKTSLTQEDFLENSCLEGVRVPSSHFAGEKSPIIRVV